MTQPHMLGFTVGGIAGGLALLLFLFVGHPTARRVVAAAAMATARYWPMVI